MIGVSSTTELTAQSRRGPLILRHPRWADFDGWATLRRESAHSLQPWEPAWTKSHLTRSTYRVRLNRFKKMIADDRAYPFHIFKAESDQFVGACNLTHVERSAAQSAKLGYWIGDAYTNRGYAFGAISALIRFGFDQLRLHRIEAAVQADNAPSIRVLEKLGFQKEGTARGYLKIDGVWTDHIIYARLRSD